MSVSLIVYMIIGTLMALFNIVMVVYLKVSFAKLCKFDKSVRISVSNKNLINGINLVEKMKNKGTD